MNITAQTKQSALPSSGIYTHVTICRKLECEREQGGIFGKAWGKNGNGGMGE